MKDILSAAHRGVLEPFAWSRTLLAFDFDGTLAPIVSQPEAAQLRRVTRQLLAKACSLYPCVVISGRAVADLTPRVAEVGLRAAIGNHGLEPWRATAAIRRRVLHWRPRLESAVGAEKGVFIEDKGYSLAVHYRGSRAKKRVRRLVADVALAIGGVRIIGGIEVVNLVPVDAPHKGMALERERRRLGCDTAIYVGDDETDEDVFALDQPGRLLSVRVGRKAASRADFYIKSQKDIDALLRFLIRLREDTRLLVQRLEAAD